jgi:hypothetical protein
MPERSNGVPVDAVKDIVCLTPELPRLPFEDEPTAARQHRASFAPG